MTQFLSFAVDGTGVASPGIRRKVAAGSFALQGGFLPVAISSFALLGDNYNFLGQDSAKGRRKLFSPCISFRIAG